jgi:hypothetical protein
MPLNMVKRVNVPKYDELSVTKIFPLLKEDAEFMQFFPTKLPKGRLPDRECKCQIIFNLLLDFFNILNTVQFDYTQHIIKEAMKKRHSGECQAKAQETIMISDDWWGKLKQVPFVSQHKGRTVDLLKQSSKPVP